MSYAPLVFMHKCIKHKCIKHKCIRHPSRWGQRQNVIGHVTFKQKATLSTITMLNKYAAENNTTYCSWQSLGTSLRFLFSLRCTAVCHNIASFLMKTSECHTVTSPLAPWTPAGILCQSDKQSPDTSQPLTEQKKHRKRSGTCHISLPRNYSAPYVSGWRLTQNKSPHCAARSYTIRRSTTHL